jgi:DegV family protein with EDD domain
MISQQMEELDLRIEVIDSRSLSIGLGRLVLKAAKLINQGTNFSDLVTTIKQRIDKTNLFFIVKTLKYLKKGGRIGKVQGTIGEFLNIKPIISIDEDGEYYTHTRTRGRKRSLNKLYQLGKEQIQKGLCKVDIMHAAAQEEGQKLLDKLAKLDNVRETYLGEIGPSMVVHTGPGLIGMLVSPLDSE